MRKRIFLIVAALLFLAAAGTFYMLAYTQTGIELAAAQLSRLGALGIHVEGVSGRLSGPLRIARFELDHKRAHIVVEDIVIDLKLRWLALQTIDIDAMTARTARVELKVAPDEPPPVQPFRFLPAFLRIAVTRADIASITLTTATGQTITTQSARTAVRLRSDRLWLDDFAIVSPLFTAQGTLELGAGRPLGLQVTATGTMSQGDRPALDLAATASGTVEAFEFEATLRNPAVAQAKGRFSLSEGRWQLEGQATATTFSLAPWLERPPFSLSNVQLDFRAQPQAIQLTGQLTVPQLDSQPLKVLATGQYAERTLRFTTVDIQQTQGPARVQAEGRIAFTGGAPALNVAAEWTRLRWPLPAANPVLTSSAGRLTLSGPLPYQFSLSAAIAGPRIPVAKGLVNGVLSREQVVIDSYRIAMLDGTVAGKGILEFAAPRRWSLDATATDLNPVTLNREFPGRIALIATASGSGLNANAAFDATVTRLQGVLRGLPLSGRGQVARNAAGWRIENSALALGDARLTVAGTVRDTLDVRWTFAANSLGALLPDVAGRLRLDGSAVGPLHTPHVIAEVDAAGLEYAGWSAGSIVGKADVDLRGVAPSQLAIEARNAGSGALRADSLELSGNGNAEAHALKLHLKSTAGNGRITDAALEVAGRYADATWTGQIASGRVGNPEGTQAVAIRDPARVVISRDRADVERLCVFLLDSSLCGNGHWQRNGPWQAEASGEGIPLDVLRLAMPSQSHYLGKMDVQLAASGAAGSPWQGTASTVLTDGALVYQLLSDDAKTTETVEIGSGTVNVSATPDEITAIMGLANTAGTFIAANATLTRLPGRVLGELPLTGRVRGRMSDANLLPLLVAEIDHAGGVLTADVAVSGRLNAPQLAGRIELNRGELDLYRVNLALRDMEIGLDLTGNQLVFAGAGRAGEGTWNLGGQLAWRNGLPAGTLTLKGENLLVADLPEYRVVASPDLGFAIDGRKIGAQGEVFIPSARVQPRDLSGAVQVSPDSRLVHEEVATGSGFTVSSDVRIRLGDDVQLDTFGLQGKLAGTVGTSTRTGDIAVGRGELSVSDGKYAAYGQKLDIARGRLLFDASPLDDPGLDIQAERTIDTVKVGLNVRGTLRQPRFGFYSEPAMSQTQIMSYLLVGKPLDDLQNRDTATVGSARDSLALQGGGILAAQLGRRLGLGELGVESNGANDTALVLGRFLSPRLFVSYGISLAESINTLKLRYTISDRWVLKTEAGENQSADVEFTIERP